MSGMPVRHAVRGVRTLSLRRTMTTMLPMTESDLDALGPEARRRPGDLMTQALVAEQLLTLRHTHELMDKVLSPQGLVELDSFPDWTLEEKEALLTELLEMCPPDAGVSSLQQLAEVVPMEAIKVQLNKISSQSNKSNKSGITYDYLEQQSLSVKRYGSPNEVIELAKKYKNTNELSMEFLTDAASAILRAPMASFPANHLLSLLSRSPENKNFTTLAAIIGATFPIQSVEQLLNCMDAAVAAGDNALFDTLLRHLRLIDTKYHNKNFIERVTHGDDTLPLEVYTRALRGLLELDYPENQIALGLKNLFTGVVIDSKDQTVRVRIFYEQRKSHVDPRMWDSLPLEMVNVVLKSALRFNIPHISEQCIKTLDGRVKRHELSRETYFDMLQHAENEPNSGELLEFLQSQGDYRA